MAKHWLTTSQWAFITEQHYRKIQTAAKEHAAFAKEHAAFAKEHAAFAKEHAALAKEHAALKQEFYATRAYFNNTHDTMTDVWSYPSVQADERHDHATPKPVEIMKRIILSSSKVSDLILDPFAGSGSTLIAAHITGRICYTIELDPTYCDIICARYQKQTGDLPRLEATGETHNFLPDAD